MTYILPLAMALFSQQGFAAWDSVAVFHRSEKVVVLINEDQNSDRLQRFMDLFADARQIVFESTDKALKLQCGRETAKASCTFRFLPSPNHTIEPKLIQAQRFAHEFLSADFDPVKAEGFRMEFLNSNGDEFALWISDGTVFFVGRKK